MFRQTYTYVYVYKRVCVYNLSNTVIYANGLAATACAPINMLLPAVNATALACR